LNFPKGSRKSARIHNQIFNIQKTLSNHLAERQTIPKLRDWVGLPRERNAEHRSARIHFYFPRRAMLGAPAKKLFHFAQKKLSSAMLLAS
jgi:hypothetical protein